MKSKDFFKIVYYVSTFIRIFSLVFFFIDPLLGWGVCFLLDAFDYTFSLRFMSSYDEYQNIDKVLDLLSRVYLVFIAYFFSWPYIWIFVLLFLLRLIGDIFYFCTRKEEYFFYFPNIIEFFFPLFILILPSISGKKVVFILIISTIAKIVQEYVAHIKKWVNPLNLKYLEENPECERDR